MEMNENIDEVPIKWHMIRQSGCFHSFYRDSRRNRVISRRNWSENRTKCGISSTSNQLANHTARWNRVENRMNISLDRNLFLLTARAVMAIGFYSYVAFERKMIANNWNIPLDAMVDDQWFVVFLLFSTAAHTKTQMKCVPAKCPVGIIFPLVPLRSLCICFRCKK